jgi:hypothetical protein
VTEPAVTLTDWLVAAECTAFTALLLRDPPRDRELRHWFAVLFASLSAAALLGGAVHGFFSDGSSLGQALLWPGTLISIGVASLAGWALAARLLLPDETARQVRWLAWLQLAVFVAVVLFVTRRFWIAVATYLPAALLLGIAFAVAWSRTRERRFGWGVLGLALTFAAAALQQLGIGLHPRYFGHNALYHTLQAIGLLGIFSGARAAIRAG